jgi:hypothetical protein
VQGALPGSEHIGAPSAQKRKQHNMYECDPENIALMGLGKSQRITFERIEKSLSDLTKRLDEMDAHLGDIKGGMFADLERLAKNNAQVVAYWQRHNDRLAK